MIDIHFDISTVIYGYLFICISLLLYNIIYIYRSKRRDEKFEKDIHYWQKSIEEQITLLSKGKSVEQTHRKSINQRLIKTDQLISYSHALDILRNQGVILDEYLRQIYKTIQALAYRYSEKENMERAFFAYFISNNLTYEGKEYRPIMEILLTYLMDSTVYCRENVLKALYVLGNSYAVESALQIINDQQWFHHQKLLSDGLISFAGDKEELAERLWTHLRKWDDNLMVAVVQFITASSDQFKERFFVALQSNEVELEIRLTILRYYRRYVYEPVRPLLLSYLSNQREADENFRIVSAFVLDQYPGEATIAALKAALHDSNWYLRYNAASSLARLKVDIRELKDIWNGDDRYAKEILSYMIDQERKDNTNDPNN